MLVPSAESRIGGETLEDAVDPTTERQMEEDLKERLSDTAVSRAPEFEEDDGSFGGEIFEEMLRTSPFSTLSSMDPSTLAAFLDEASIDPAFAAIDCTMPSFQLPSFSGSTSISGDPNDLVAKHDAIGDDILIGDPLMMPMMPLLPFSLDDERMASLSSYLGLDSANASCSHMDPVGTDMDMFFSGSMGFAAAPSDAPFPTNLSMQNGMLASLPELGEYQLEGIGNVFPSEFGGLQRAFDMADVQHLPGSCGSPVRPASEALPTDETSFKVGKLSPEERKVKICRYIKKRNRRNFSKTIKYACRKTLADSRPRVRGRFAKNDDYGETGRSNHDDEEDAVMTEDIIDSTDIFAQLKSFKCNYTRESWI